MVHALKGNTTLRGKVVFPFNRLAKAFGSPITNVVLGFCKSIEQEYHIDYLRLSCGQLITESDKREDTKASDKREDTATHGGEIAPFFL